MFWWLLILTTVSKRKPIVFENRQNLAVAKNPISLLKKYEITHLYPRRPYFGERVCDCLLHVVAGAEEEEAVGPPGGHAQDGLPGATPAGGDRFPAKRKRKIVYM